MIDQITASLSGSAPPSDLPPPLQALWWLRKGALRVGAEWELAHNICQNAEGNRPYDLVHALVHSIEGDTGNAAYWYRRAGLQPTSTDLADEWQNIVAELTG
jgi:hypothetical protein